MEPLVALSSIDKPMLMGAEICRTEDLGLKASCINEDFGTRVRDLLAQILLLRSEVLLKLSVTIVTQYSGELPLDKRYLMNIELWNLCRAWQTCSAIAR